VAFDKLRPCEMIQVKVGEGVGRDWAPLVYKQNNYIEKVQTLDRGGEYCLYVMKVEVFLQTRYLLDGNAYGNLGNHNA